MNASTKTRANVSRIQERPHAQVLIVGGGINGIATFRDLALQGIDVVLVERGDYASGASAASSHMIHGGIRYLENGEFRLVRESVQERNGLLRIAPHYVKPLKTTIPIFSTFSGILSAPLRFLTHKQGKPKERGAFLIKVGLTTYDSFSRDGGSVPRHEFHGRRRSLHDLPRLNPTLKYTATYYDASVHEPERLALDVLKDGLASGSHARSANYVEAIGVKEGGVLVRDTVSGAEFTISADVVINASGPWTDLTNEAFAVDSAFMGGTKGSHIVLDNPELLAALDGRELFFENNDGRIVLIYPLKGRVLVGTTDLEADIREVAVCTEEEVDYFFDLIAQVLPDVAVTREQIVFRYSGVRPLPRHEDTQPGFVSRDYRIVEGTIPGLADTALLSLVGGKWTTFRALSEHLANEALDRLGATRTVSTAGLAIGGGKDFPATEQARSAWIRAHSGAVDADTVGRLLTRYGTRAASVIETIDTADSTPLEHAPEFSVAEVAYFADHEDVVHLIDVVLRRTNVAFTGDVTLPLLRELAHILGTRLGWTAETEAAETHATVTELRERHGVILDESVVGTAG
ncbi:glycerol-3-phosphate dehydrogenase/oxidase [Galbitalea soli]|uniref:Glycerol-3-phosphate dehydrogenase/oxidase n=1 Tax=Galbitalea soli TaxID=1268042 RepID=A0A7C9TTA2_9MICO|nr:glycerol-3-phosphate dehydrogenase/oxidase [Galbitalea soli]NEM92224.1 glycerol-3-phosphate dehydrogenase/oxidase [Galbitalea soli]NYJ31822.1 glycerol-3-phosphate dehydrogenase [Galbitalea soli]